MDCSAIIMPRNAAALRKYRPGARPNIRYSPRSLVLAEPVGVGLLLGFALILVSLMLVLGIVPSIRLPRLASQTVVGRGVGG